MQRLGFLRELILAMLVLDPVRRTTMTEMRSRLRMLMNREKLCRVCNGHGLALCCCHFQPVALWYPESQCSRAHIDEAGWLSAVEDSLVLLYE
jgi:hypothetical protein